MENTTGTMELFWRMMHQSRRLREVIDKKMLAFCAGTAITPAGLRLLVTLYLDGPMTVSALAKSTCTAGTNNSALCKRLEADGLLCRRRAAEDERRVLVSLSPLGAAKVAAFLGECEGCDEARAVAGATDEINTILSGMDSLLCLLENKGDTA